MTRRGHLTLNYEQGGEGRVEWAFVDEAVAARNEDALFFLATGQRLNIVDVWQGVLDFVPVTSFDSATTKSKMWSETKQRDVPYSKWLEWFMQIPPMRAELSD